MLEKKYSKPQNPKDPSPGIEISLKKSNVILVIEIPMLV